MPRPAAVYLRPSLWLRSFHSAAVNSARNSVASVNPICSLILAPIRLAFKFYSGKQYAVFRPTLGSEIQF